MYLIGSMNALGTMFEHQRAREEKEKLESKGGKKEDDRFAHVAHRCTFPPLLNSSWCSSSGIPPEQIISFRQLKSHVDMLDVEDEQEGFVCFCLLRFFFSHLLLKR